MYAIPHVLTEVWGCEKCAQITKTCCQRCEVLVSVGDRHRIAACTGRVDFWEYRAPTDPAYVDQEDDPNWLNWAFRPDGTRPILRRRPEGDCPFLAVRGCALPMEIRPLICRLYPYEYTARGIHGVSNRCPEEVVPPGSTILKVLDMRLADAERWRSQLYDELRTGQPRDEHRPDL